MHSSAKFLVTTALLATAFTAGCAKDDKSVTAEGNCTSSYVSEYNAVNSAYRSFLISPSSYKGELKSACDTFFSNHSNRTCTAQNLMSGATETVNSSDLQSKCDAAKESTTTQPSPNSPSVDSRGNCTESFISDYNSVTKDLSDANTKLGAGKMVDFTEVTRSCERFKSAHKNVMCMADSLASGYRVPKTFYAADTIAACERVLEIKTAREAESKPVTLLVPSIQINVTMVYSLQGLLEAEPGSYYAVGGRWKDAKTVESSGYTGCTLKMETARPIPQLNYSQKFGVRSASYFQRGSHTRTYLFLDSNDLVIECIKGGSQPATLADVEVAFRDLVTITLKK